ncbi:hypothetical protein Mkiyose1384_39580 [Mycobacterium kiyosense]|nr:hypothetical protein SRL2020226_34800 [Mycobacterium kiyosense]GLD08561.1 hypothetical protein Mkiyose1383_48870 [Mycobacterium kiyosense]GLD13734.1 hypothetical protein Mkiyose1384_39580 [Mycobacterium kiyosense]GLD19678.1 hypothetical protein Mkiyose1385_37770 [Mycobacterium kiyosense]GLD25010.1 hypothetical protein Mkiyose1386_30030 [Mycobacterium kiyosense]
MAGDIIAGMELNEDLVVPWENTDRIRSTRISGAQTHSDPKGRQPFISGAEHAKAISCQQWRIRRNLRYEHGLVTGPFRTLRELDTPDRIQTPMR